MDYDLNNLIKKNLMPIQPPTQDEQDQRHQSMMDAIAPYAKPAQQKNLTEINLSYKTRHTKLVLALCPEWAPMFPPFNLARLSAITKAAGYETTIIDINIKAYNQYINDWLPNNTLPFKLWDSSASWHWLGSTYYSHIHPTLEPLLQNAVDEILALEPDVVGFSVYYISEEPTKWICQQLKNARPNIRIAIGGSNVQKEWFTIQPYYDYVVNGEGEEAIIKILDDVEQGIAHDTCQFIKQDEVQRINLNNLPMPDYASIDFSLYKIPNGINTEFSRGCTAKCTFCEETHFWKYRQRQAVDLITEIEWLYYNKGTDVIWFIDSLVNGNLKELRAFCKAVEAKGLKINWTGYARCDGRMDLEYFKDLKAGGCIMLNYGIESGSQRVLDDMDKGVTIKDMEQNFRDGKAVGIWASTNWIIGFPTEAPGDLAASMIFLWRNRNNNINNVGAGNGFGLGPETIAGQNPDKFNLSYHKYHGHWITKDFKVAGPHVMTRVKSFYIYLDLIVNCATKAFSYPKRSSLARQHYMVNFHNENIGLDVEYENFDYVIIKPNLNPFADSLVNEIWPLLRTLWRCRGGYDIEIKFNPEIDLEEFGTQFGPGGYTADFKFSINNEGDWQANFHYSYNQNLTNPDDLLYHRPEWRHGPFYAQDYSRMQSNTASRARRLAKPSWDLDQGRDSNEFDQLIQEEIELNKLDFSFEYVFSKHGSWKDTITNIIDVPNQSRVKSIPIQLLKLSKFKQ